MGSTQKYWFYFLLTEYSALACSPSILGCSPSVPSISGLYEQICNGKIDFINSLAWLFPWTLHRVKAHLFLPMSENDGIQNSSQSLRWIEKGEGRKCHLLNFTPALVGGFMAPAVPWYLQRALKLH